MSEPMHVLLIEDNPGDADLIKETLEETGLRLAISVAVDGAQAMYSLFRTTTATLPVLILLDLNLPRMDGRQVLAEIKRHEKLKRIPVVVLTSSDAEQDVHRCYDLNASCYVTKPVGLDSFQSVVRSIAGFWLSLAKLP
jgi:chemotaxis family two-component system response regulator Rcp1